MATTKAFIRTSTKVKDFVNVRFRLTDGRTIQLFHKSDIKVNPTDFDAKNEKIKAKILFVAKERMDFDKSINDRKDMINKLYLNAPDKSILTSDWLENAIDRKLYPAKYMTLDEVPAPTTLLAYVADFIKNAPKRKDKKNNTYITPGTIKSYNTNYQRLLAYAKYKKRKDFAFSEINMKFYENYVEFLTNRKVKIKTVRGEEVNIEKQYTKGTIGDAVKALKTFIADVKEIPIERKELYVFTEEVDNVFLNETELQLLRDYDFSTDPILDRVVDWFLLMAWTASRISDKNQLGDINNGFIKYEQQKTGNPVYIPVHPVVTEIIAKHNGQLPNQSTDAEINYNIKDACKLAGIVGMESLSRIRGGKKEVVYKPKHELISSHTCRRSFCTNMYLRGMDTLMIMAISGHKTLKSFLIYIKVSQQQHAEMMAKKWSEIYK